MARSTILRDRRTLRPCIAAAACALAALTATSCSIAPKPVGASRAGGARTGGTAFEPVELRIHPLTRARESEGGAVGGGGAGSLVDLYFELLDRWGHGVKSLGTLTVELRAVGEGGRREPFQVRSWTVMLTDPGVNSGAYDRVTRTYHIVLEDVPAGANESELLVRFRGAGAKQLSSTYDLE